MPKERRMKPEEHFMQFDDDGGDEYGPKLVIRDHGKAGVHLTVDDIDGDQFEGILTITELELELDYARRAEAHRKAPTKKQAQVLAEWKEELGL